MIRVLFALGLSGLMCACSGAATDGIGSDAGTGGSIGEAGAPAVSSGGAGAASAGAPSAGSAGKPAVVDMPEAGAGGMSGVESEAGAAGEMGSAGAATVEPVPGSLWSECVPGDSCTTPADTCGTWAKRAGDPASHLCTFQCWSLQPQGQGKPPHMAPDTRLVAQCSAAGGICYSSDASYPVCVPHEPQ